MTPATRTAPPTRKATTTRETRTRRTTSAVLALVAAVCLGGCLPTPNDDPFDAPDAPAPTGPLGEPEGTSSAEPTQTPTPTPGPSSPEPTAPDVSGPVASDELLGANPVTLEIGVGIDAVECNLPAWSMGPAAAEGFYAEAIRCHTRAWRDTLARFDIELEPPGLWAGARSADYDGACGTNTTGREAFYCGEDQTIVMPFDSMSTIAQYGAGHALAVLSHEYGHHIQNQIGVSAGYAARREVAGWDSAEGQLLSRQLELQAWCFSGMFYGTSVGRGSISQAMSDAAYDNNSHAGDRPGELREHGTDANIAGWFDWGRHPSDDPGEDVRPTTYECNPWAARDASTLE
ncbi:neutral zinc metallopeptidase [Georgenia alba]|uniref:Neutral zinc metallopeptidase n=1 Tax=Georgenia alba TaxID=2233858 RepID=A0ABW2QB40_9MICO